MYDEDEDEDWSVEPVTLYEAYCCVTVEAEPDKGLDEGDCAWSYICDRYDSDADCEVELTVNLLREHDIIRILPDGYEYMQEKLDQRLKETRSDA